MLEIIQVTDFAILDWIQGHLRCGWMDGIMPKITFLGEWGLLWILVAVFFLLRKPDRRSGIKIAVALAGCLIFGLLIIKNIAARPRPCWINADIDMLIAVPRDYSFPSGHTMSSVSAALIIFRKDRRIGIPAMIMAVLIAFSRLYLYVHFPTDVLVGAVLGILTAILADKLVERFFKNAIAAGCDEAS